jgi:D-xylose transport system substrate-binding protein
MRLTSILRNLALWRPGSRRRWRGAGIGGALACVLVAVAFSSAASGASNEGTAARATGHTASNTAIYRGTGTVAFLAPAVTITIWSDSWVPQYVSFIHQYAPHVKVLKYFANNDVATQLQQEQSAIAQGAKLLVIAAVDPSNDAGLANYAKAHHVTVIASNREFPNFAVAGYVEDNAYLEGQVMARWLVSNTQSGDTIATLWGDSTDIGYAVPMKNGVLSVLGPLFKSGARKEVGNVFTPQYLPTNAHTEMSAILTQTSNHVNAVFAANDDMAGGAIAALQAVNLAGKVKVIGGDATISGVQRILEGTQTATLYHSLGNQQVAAETTSYILAGKKVPAGLYNTKFANGKVSGKVVKVPALTRKPIVVTKSNVNALLTSRFLTKKIICKGLPGGVPFCK